MVCKRLLVGLLLACLSLTGCAPVFIAAGAGGAYLVTQKGAMRKVDRFFQDLERSIRQTTRRIYGERRTRQRVAYQSKSGLMLQISNSSLAPTRAGKGDRVQCTVQYVLLGGPASGTKVREKSRLLSGGKELAVLKVDTTTRQNGTWESALTFVVPSSAKPGKYTVVQEISAEGLRRNARRSFTVR